MFAFLLLRQLIIPRSKSGEVMMRNQPKMEETYLRIIAMGIPFKLRFLMVLMCLNCICFFNLVNVTCSIAMFVCLLATRFTRTFWQYVKPFTCLRSQLHIQVLHTQPAMQTVFSSYKTGTFISSTA